MATLDMAATVAAAFLLLADAVLLIHFFRRSNRSARRSGRC